MPHERTLEKSDYSMRQWFFEDSAGRYDINLGDSYARCGRLQELALPADLTLGYGSDRGIPKLRELIAGLYGGTPDRVLATHGAQEALSLIYRALLRPGDRVITFRPGWQQSWMLPEKLGAGVHTIHLDGDYDIDVDEVVKVVDDSVRLIVVNTPGNPTGRVTGRHTIDALAGIAARLGAYLIVDEEYEIDVSSSGATRHDHVISIGGLSKVYGLPGLRVGWMYGPPEVLSACLQYKYLTSISNSILCEELACDVLTRRDHFAESYVRDTAQGFALLNEWASRYSGQLRLIEPQGTPFAWVRLLTGQPSIEFCRRVLDLGVLLMPGETVGSPDGFRIGFARPPEVLAEGLKRIGTLLARRDHE